MQRNQLDIGDPARIYLIAFLAMFLLGIPLSIFKGDAYLFLGYAIPQICFLAVLVLFARIKKIPFTDIVPFKKALRPAALGLTFVVTSGLFLQNLLLAVGFQWLLDAGGIQVSVKIPDLSKTENVLWAVLFMCALPAVGEEFLFRGAALSSFRNRSGLAAAFFSAAFFSLSHGNAAQLVHQFILGFLLAYITLRTGNILYAVCAHFFNNLLAILLPLLLPAFNALNVCNIHNALILLGLSAIGIIVLYPSLAMLIRIAGDKRYSRFKEFFRDKSAYACYNDTVETPSTETSGTAGRIWLIVLFVFLILQLVVNTVIAAVPALNHLLS